MSEPADPKREFLRHVLATLAYRGGRALAGAPEDFPGRRFAETTRTPVEILAHMNDLLDWSLTIVRGAQKWHDSTPQAWNAEIARFFAALAALDRELLAGLPPSVPPERLFQGPLADAHTHVGQIAMMRRMAGCPIRGENFFVADINAGTVGPELPPPRRQFD